MKNVILVLVLTLCSLCLVAHAQTVTLDSPREVRMSEGTKVCEQADKLLDEGKPSEALKLYQQVLTFLPTSPRAKAGVAECKVLLAATTPVAGGQVSTGASHYPTKYIRFPLPPQGTRTLLLSFAANAAGQYTIMEVDVDGNGKIETAERRQGTARTYQNCEFSGADLGEFALPPGPAGKVSITTSWSHAAQPGKPVVDQFSGKWQWLSPAGQDTWSYAGTWLGRFSLDNLNQGSIYGEKAALRPYPQLEGVAAGQAIVRVQGVSVPWGTATNWLKNGAQCEMKLRVTDEKGTAVHQGALQAGSNGLFETTVTLPGGKYVAEVRTDTGPIAGEVAGTVPFEVKASLAATQRTGLKGPVMKVGRRIFKDDAEGTDNYSLMSWVQDFRECCASDYVLPEKSMLVVRPLDNVQLTDVQCIALAEELATVQAPVGVQMYGQKELTIKGITALAKVPNLRSLALMRFDNLDDKACETIATAKELRFLWLNQNAKITDQGIQYLGALPELGYLNIGDTPVVGSGLKALSGCNKLDRIYVGSAAFKDAAPLGAFTSVRELALWGAKDTTGLEELRNLQRLKWLSVHGIDCPPDKLKFLSELPELMNLSIQGNQLLTDISTTPIPQITRLKYLSLRDCRNLAAGLNSLGGLRALDSLDLQGCRSLDGTGLKVLTGAPIFWLDLSGCESMKDAGLSEVGSLTQVNQLEADGTGLGDGAVAQWQGLASMTRLDAYNTPLTDAGMEALARLPVRYLGLNGCKAITDKGLMALTRSDKLQSVGVGGTAVTDAGIAAARQAKPQLQISK